ncbi:hypothetical protein Bbelb_044220 [Branchiostoma belcheri]|nr:hypothetical protein Bbelb_044220 [Branchiostoma belcheri]
MVVTTAARHARGTVSTPLMAAMEASVVVTEADSGGASGGVQEEEGTSEGVTEAGLAVAHVSVVTVEDSVVDLEEDTVEEVGGTEEAEVAASSEAEEGADSGADRAGSTRDLRPAHTLVMI